MPTARSFERRSASRASCAPRGGQAGVKEKQARAPAILPSMPAPLIEFPADDPDRARRFWHGVLGVTLARRPAAAGSGWQTDTDGLRLGVHERGPGPGDTASLPYFTVADLATTLERVRSSAARSSTPAIGGRCAGTPRAARSRWPPRPHAVSSTDTIAARAKQTRAAALLRMDTRKLAASFRERGSQRPAKGARSRMTRPSRQLERCRQACPAILMP